MGVGFMRQLFDSLHKNDSAYYYSSLEASLNARIFNQNNINKIQALAFNEQIRNIEEEAKGNRRRSTPAKHSVRFDRLRHHHICYTVFIIKQNSHCK